jgi:uncharacterized protein with NRDE domain
MCLILFAWQAHPRYSLVLAANREEFHERPTAAAEFWQDHSGLLAGCDLQAGGTWLGVTRTGRFAAITNYREPQAPELQLEYSRGHLVRDFLIGEESPRSHATLLHERGGAYHGYNLLLGVPEQLSYVSNRNDRPTSVSAGIHGLSNHLLDTDWPKVHSGRDHLESLLAGDEVEPEDLFELLTDRTLTPGKMPEDFENSELPEQLMRHYFIVSPVYGTRSSSVLLVSKDGNVEFIERQFDPDGMATGTSRFEFQITSSLSDLT